MPLIEFICYNPKQCKAGFSQAPAAWLPIKIPSRTANPPSRLDIKQPVSTKRQAKPPRAPAFPRAPSRSPGAAVPRGSAPGPGSPPGWPWGTRGGPGARGTEQTRGCPGAHGIVARLSAIPPMGVFRMGFQSRWWPCAWGCCPKPLRHLGCPTRPHTTMLKGPCCRATLGQHGSPVLPRASRDGAGTPSRGARWASRGSPTTSAPFRNLPGASGAPGGSRRPQPGG